MAVEALLQGSNTALRVDTEQTPTMRSLLAALLLVCAAAAALAQEGDWGVARATYYGAAPRAAGSIWSRCPC